VVARRDRRWSTASIRLGTTPMSLSSSPSDVVAKVVLGTHSVALDGVAFEQAVAIRTPDGAEVLPAAVEQARGSGHHREAVVVFPALPQSSGIRIVVKDVGGVAARTFSWD
jgi:hypothetical protein